MGKTKYSTIIINIECESDAGFENSLDEAVKSIKAGNVYGKAGNNEEGYNFTVAKS